MPCHACIKRRSSAGPTEVAFDRTPEEVEEEIARPIRLGHLVRIGHWRVRPHDMEWIRITFTDEPALEFARKVVSASLWTRLVAFRASPRLTLEHGKDVTAYFLRGALGYFPPQMSGGQGRDIARVFVVYGQNDRARDAMFTFLRSIELHPLEWPELVADTKKGSPPVPEIIDAGLAGAQAAVVLLTPDEEVRLRGDRHPPQFQSRPNVFYEAGKATTLFPDRTVIVELGDMRPFSDISGLHVVRMNDSTQRRQELAERLRTVGCPVNLRGTDWHTAGRFEPAIDPHNPLR